MNLIKSLWYGDKSFSFTFLTIGVLGTFILQFVCLYSLIVLGNAQTYTINCNDFWVWVVETFSRFEIFLFFIIIKTSYFFVASIAIWRSARKISGQNIEALVSFFVMIWILAIVLMYGMELIMYVGI